MVACVIANLVRTTVYYMTFKLAIEPLIAVNPARIEVLKQGICFVV